MWHDNGSNYRQFWICPTYYIPRSLFRVYKRLLIPCNVNGGRLYLQLPTYMAYDINCCTPLECLSPSWISVIWQSPTLLGKLESIGRNLVAKLMSSSKEILWLSFTSNIVEQTVKPLGTENFRMLGQTKSPTPNQWIRKLACPQQCGRYQIKKCYHFYSANSILAFWIISLAFPFSDFNYTAYGVRGRAAKI